jgi:GNAT superfamily N-acetyltransferase
MLTNKLTEKSSSKVLIPDIQPLREYPHWLTTVAAWHHEVWLNEQRDRFGHVDPVRAQDSLQKRCELLRSHLSSDPLPESFIAIYHERVVASVSIVRYQFLSGQDCSEWLTNVYVAPEYRRRGIAAQIIDRACEYAASLGVPELKLYTSERAEYYRKLGWQGRGSGHVQGREVDILSRKCV